MSDFVFPFADIGELVKIAVRAGQIVMQHYQSSTLGIFKKSDHSPVTDADREAHRFIHTSLLQLTPHTPVLSEEGEHIPYEARKAWETFWLVDPLDGTQEFIGRTGHFAVCIGLIHQNYPVAGAVYLPAIQELFFADGKQSFKMLLNGTTVRLQLPHQPLQTPWRAVCSKGKMPEQDRAFLWQNWGINRATPMGSALKYCALAEGKADIFYRTRGNSEWDSAAGQAVLEQAGGHILAMNGERFSYNKPSLVNPPFVCLGFSDKQAVMPALQAAGAQ
ncbi:3'(2'),5'-bisphosphate nucleotidase CysQ [Rhodoflexus caldus]|uniref:3'(2'),5'-bisphosphate nucleotidase CysQ n=1 Tax=Rhodoflexus caldus TaxID=2891236 RepID=UPI00202ABBE7|nr:3'(2'),5'-bisphosphate nucleotidase CysQ [Rhodoflexus caldus]